jgi:hypothetical protein
MTHTTDLERYIFNCLAKFNLKLRQYREDVLQEICYAILVSDSKEEALHLSKRLCDKLMLQYGHNSEQAKEIYREICLSSQYEEEESNKRSVVEEAARLYREGCGLKEICRRINVEYNASMSRLFLGASAYMSI